MWRLCAPIAPTPPSSDCLITYSNRHTSGLPLKRPAGLAWKAAVAGAPNVRLCADANTLHGLSRTSVLVPAYSSVLIDYGESGRASQRKVDSASAAATTAQPLGGWMAASKPPIAPHCCCCWPSTRVAAFSLADGLVMIFSDQPFTYSSWSSSRLPCEPVITHPHPHTRRRDGLRSTKTTHERKEASFGPQRRCLLA